MPRVTVLSPRPSPGTGKEPEEDARAWKEEEGRDGAAGMETQQDGVPPFPPPPLPPPGL